MGKAAINWESIPPQLITELFLRQCLKCGFDLMTKRLGLAARTAYSEMKKFVPDAQAFRAREVERPLFRSAESAVPCPYCEAAKRWVATIRLVEIDVHKDISKQAKALLTAVRRHEEEYTIAKDTRLPIQVFSDWLERLSHRLNFDGERWMRDATLEYLRRREPGADWSESEKVSQVLPSRRLEEGWEQDGNRLYLSPALYGDVLVVQYLLSRTHLHGARTFEGRLTAFEFYHRLRRAGYLEKRGIEADDPGSALEGAINKLSEEGVIKPVSIIDRTAYLEQLKALYERMKK
jgi:hypothetical protein